MAEKIIVHDFQGFGISQRSDGFVNLTEMAKAGGKEVGGYLRTKSTKAYLSGLSEDMHIDISKLVVKRKGRGDAVEQATWAHPDVAIDFAQWVSVQFRIWANRELRQRIISGSIHAEEFTAQKILDQFVLREHATWERRFSKEWIRNAERLTGMTWSCRAMAHFINKCIYEAFPEEIQAELDRVNPTENGNRRRKQHQHLQNEALAYLDARIQMTLTLMEVSSSKAEFFALLAVKDEGIKQLNMLFLAS